MQHIASLAKVSRSNPPASTPNSTSENAPQAEAPTQWLRRLWERMVAMYGHAWTSVNGLTPQDLGTGALTISGDTWAKALAGLTGPEFGVGLEACLAEGGEFPPSAPRFRSMCLGIPSFAAVRLEITAPDAERSPFTRSVWMFVDSFAYRQATARDGDRILREAYELAKESRMRGAPLPEPARAIMQDAPAKPVKLEPDRLSFHLANIRAELGLSESEGEAMGTEGLMSAAGLSENAKVLLRNLDQAQEQSDAELLP